MKQEITIPIFLPKENKLKHVKVQASMVGEYFAVHKTRLPGMDCHIRGVKSNDVFNIGYSITHINTGFAVGTGFTKSAAMEFADLLSTTLPLELQKTTNPNHSSLIQLVNKYHSLYTNKNPYWYAIPKEISIKSLLNELTEVYRNAKSKDDLDGVLEIILALSGMIVENPYQSLTDTLLAKAQTA